MTTTQKPKPSASGVARPGGIICLMRADAPLTGKELFWTNPYIDGVVVRTGWSNSAPARGVYDFSYLQNAMNYGKAFGKQIGFYTMALYSFPTWLNPKTIDTGGAKKGDLLAIPWDPSFLDEFLLFIAAAGEALGLLTNYTVMGGLGGAGESILTKDAKIVKLLDAAGGMPEWIRSSTAIADAYAKAFPQSSVIISAQNPYGGLPSEIMQAGDALNTFVTATMEKYPGHAGVKNSTLSDHSQPKGANRFMPQYSATNPAMHQCVNSSVGFGETTPPLGSMEGALKVAATVMLDQAVEVYAIDCLNTTFNSLFNTYGMMLKANIKN